MELKDMTFPQVLALQIFQDELQAQMDVEKKALNDAGRIHNRTVLQELIRRGEFTAHRLTAAYYHIAHKEETAFTARERQYISDICTLAYISTIRRLQNESEENSRNPLLRFVRWLLAKCHIKKDIV
jgi:hypothetical protein